MRKNNVWYIIDIQLGSFISCTCLIFIYYFIYINILPTYARRSTMFTSRIHARYTARSPPPTVDRSAGSILDALYRPPPLHAVYFVIIIIHSNRNRFCVDKFLAFISLVFTCCRRRRRCCVSNCAYPLGWRLLCVGTFLYSTIKKFDMKFIYLKFCLYVYYKSNFLPFWILRVFLS